MTARRGLLALVLLGLLCPGTASAAEPPVSFTVERTALRTELGGQVVLSSRVRNTGRVPTGPLVLHLSVLGLRGQPYTDPEDWSTQRVRFLPPLASVRRAEHRDGPRSRLPAARGKRAVLTRRLTVRVRVALAFAGAVALLLTVIGIVLYARIGAQLDATIEQGLRARAADVSALIQRREGRLDAAGRSVLVERNEGFAQLLTPGGAVLDASPGLRSTPLLDSIALRRAGSGTILVQRPNPFEAREPARLLATPVRTAGRRVVVVVGVGADDRNSQLAGLALLLAISGPIALLLASLAGYGVATGALRPVEAMRRKAEEITDADPGERLPVGPAEDEIARLGTTLNTMLDRLEQAARRERAFVADASHELRTPVAIMKTEIEVALRRERSAPELREVLVSTAEEVDRLGETADALLLLARAQDGRMPVLRTEVALGELLAGVATRLGLRVAQHDRRLEVAPAAGRARLDVRRVEQALDGLVENALDHGDGTIRLTAEVGPQTVVLCVADEGPGFPLGFERRAFERFARADPARGHGGAGLGLAIVQLIAHAHGGEARAGRAAGGGAEVRLELPL